MKRYMLLIVGALLFSTILAGCASVNVGNARNEPPPAMAPVDDARPVATIRAENAQLRARNAELEDAYRQWQAAVAHEEKNKKDLKAQRDREEKDLKIAKDQAKKQKKR